MQKNWVKKALLFVVCTTLSLSALAATDWKQLMNAQGSKIVKEFSSPSGFRGFVIQRGGIEKTFYVTENGEFLFSGELYGEDGLPVSPKSAASKSIPDWSKVMAAKGNTVVKEFKSESGFRGLVVDRNGAKKIFYVTANGKFLASGEVYNATGGSITKVEMAQQIGQSDVANTINEQDKAVVAMRELETVPSEFKNRLFAAAEKTAWVEEGTGNNVVYVIFDPVCPHCHKTWELFRPYVSRGLLRVRWVPVILLSGNNMQSPAAQMGASFLANRGEAGIVQKLFNQTIKPVMPDEKMAKTLSQNLLFLRDTGFRGVPVMIYQRAGERNAFVVPERPEVAQIDRMIRK